jgi:hypothetical protein
MTEAPDEPNVWERLDDLSDHELEGLVAAAISVLEEGADDPSLQNVADMPPGPTASELRSLLGGAGVEAEQAELEQLVTDEATARELALATLRELGREPQLAAAIEEAWRARSGMMIVDAGFVIAGALLLLVMKLKRVQVGKGEVDVEFYEAKSETLGAVRRLLGQ